MKYRVSVSRVVNKEEETDLYFSSTEHVGERPGSYILMMKTFFNADNDEDPSGPGNYYSEYQKDFFCEDWVSPYGYYKVLLLLLLLLLPLLVLVLLVLALLLLLLTPSSYSSPCSSSPQDCVYSKRWRHWSVLRRFREWQRGGR